MKKALLIVAQENFQPKEYKDTKDELEKEKIEVVVASLEKGVAVGADGSEVIVELGLNEINIDFDAVVLIGGGGAAEQLVDNEDIFRIVKEFYEKEKIVAAICIAPVALANADLLEGKKATVWDGDGVQSDMFLEQGIGYTGEEVTIDGRIITANGPMAAKEFGHKIAKMLKSAEKSQEE